MMTTLIFLSLLLDGRAFSQDNADKPRVRHAPVINTEAEHQSYIHLDERRDWRGWLASNFPDNSASWDAACSKNLDARSKAAGWDFIAKGDFNKLGAPTAVMVRFGKVTGSAKGKMVVSFSIIECQSGSWIEILGLDSKTGMSANGEALDGLQIDGMRGYSVLMATGTKAIPGLQISVRALNDRGQGISEGVDFDYLPKEKKYDVDAR